MAKWIIRTVVLLLLAGGGWVAYDYYRAGYNTMPTLPAGGFPLSFKSGFRGIMIDTVDVRPDRRYRATPAQDVPDWYQKTWSICRPLADDEAAYLKEQANRGPGHRWEAICEIDSEGESFIRGWIASVPNN
jgi:hypothetical protein